MRRLSGEGLARAGWWWLRSPGNNQNNAANVNTDGSVNRNGNNVNNDNNAVRPALWLDLNSKIIKNAFAVYDSHITINSEGVTPSLIQNGEIILYGEAKGFDVEKPISVRVTLIDGKIADVIIVDHDESKFVAEEAIEQLPLKIIAANSPDVDTIAGATWTSKGIIEAVRNALDFASEE